MEPNEIANHLSIAEKLVEEADTLCSQFVESGVAGPHDDVMVKTDAITDKLEEAQQVLLELDVGEVEEEVDDEAEEASRSDEAEDDQPKDPLAALPTVKEEAFSVMVEKQKLEHRSREIESRAYRKAADLVGEPIVTPGTANEQQDELLNHAATALEAAFASYPNPEVLLTLARLRIEQLEIKKATAILEGVLGREDATDAREEAEQLMEKIQSDPSLKDRSRCFIATAACGDEDAEPVVELRLLRDQVLMRTPAGRKAVRCYYAWSPPVARLLESNPWLGQMVLHLLVKPAAAWSRVHRNR